MPPRNVIIHQKISANTQQRAKELRQKMTPSESKLWEHLRTNRLAGLHFRRQQVIEPYIVDFYCHQAALVIEVDGEIHLQQQEADRQRDQYLQSIGLRILRITNSEVDQDLDLDAVMAKILKACEKSNERNNSLRRYHHV